MEGLRRDRRTGRLVVAEPLRERFPNYLKLFGIGLGVIGLVAVVVTLVTDTPPGQSFGYSAVFTGLLLLLVGGARGGGYTNLGVGAVEAVVGGRNRMDDDPVSDEELRRGNVMKRRDPMARLRRGLRPPPNPTAFWQSVAGFAYIAIGLPFVW